MMSLAAGELFLLSLAWLCLVSCSFWSLLAPWLLRSLESWSAARQHSALLMLAAAPAVSAALLALAALTPSLLSLAVPALDHCLAHDDGHAHLCFLHEPVHAPHVLIWVVVASVLTWAGVHALLVVADLVRAHRRLRVLLRTGQADSERGVTLIESEILFCAAAGLLAPRVVVSRTLLEMLSPVHRQALLAHEKSHVERRDALRGLFARTLATMYPARLRRRIMDAIGLAAERACDEEAARLIGDRLTVADTILRVERALSGTFSRELELCSVGMNHSKVELRVESLLAEPKSGGSLARIWAILSASAIALCLAADEIHHSVESFLSPLLK